jgi:hypothetical protein
MIKTIQSFWIGCFCAVCIPLTSWSCDICGCSSSAFGMGWLPGQPQHFIGLQWTQRGYTSTHRTLFNDEIPIVTREQLQEVDLIGRWSMSRRWQITGKWGYRLSNSVGNASRLETRSFNDPSWMLMRVFGRLDDTLCAQMNHTWVAGIGLEMPLSASRLRDEAGSVMPTLLQPGSGSWDPLFRAAYAGNSLRQGWLIEVQGMLSTYRKNGDRRGHQCSASWRYHRRLRLRNDLVIVPHLSAALECVGREWIDDRHNNDSGGSAAYLRPGVDVTFRSIALRTYVQCRAWSRLSDGLVVPSSPIHCSLIYLIQNKK